MKNLNKAFFFGLFAFVVVVEIFVHLHDQQTISQLRTSLQEFRQLAEDTPNSAAQKISEFSNQKIKEVFDFFNSDAGDSDSQQETDVDYEVPMELLASETEFLETRQCKPEKNVFFLKTSKTGSQTLMAIMQRFGIQNNLTFFLGESMNGAMSNLQIPISYERDCWIGKNLPEEKFQISTQHLKYNKELIDNVMEPGTKFFSIIRDPTTNFVSSYRYYQYLLGRLWSQFRLRSIGETKGAPSELLYKEMEHFLEDEKRAWRYLKNVSPGSFARIGTLRPQLIFFGSFTDENGKEWMSYDKDIPEEVLQAWFKKLDADFEFVMIMEYYDLGLALLVNEFCWSIEDVAYLKVNAQAHSGLELSKKAVRNLEKINYPDYALYRYFNQTFWQKVDSIGRAKVEAIAELIGTKSAEIAQRCIQDDYLNNNGTQKIKPRLKEGVYEDAECGRFLMHGPSMTKVTQRYMIDHFGKKYKSCSKSATPTTWSENMEKNKESLRYKYKFLSGHGGRFT